MAQAPTHQQGPQATRVPSPGALAVLPTRRAGGEGQQSRRREGGAQCEDCDVWGGSAWAWSGRVSARHELGPDRRAEASTVRVSRGDMAHVLAALGCREHDSSTQTQGWMQPGLGREVGAPEGSSRCSGFF